LTRDTASYISQCSANDRLFILSSVQSGYQLSGSDRGGAYPSPIPNTARITNPESHRNGVSEFERLVLGDGRIELLTWLQRAVASQPGVSDSNAAAFEYLREREYLSSACSDMLTKTLR